MPEQAPPRHAPGRKVRILIVDADADSRESLCTLVSDLGHTVCHAAEPGPPTLERLAEADPDLTLIGLRVGAAADATLETAERVADRSRAPIVYVTERTDAALLDRAQHAHPRGFVLKSAGAEQLDLTIRTALNGATRVVGHEKGNRELLLMTLFDSMTDAMVIADAGGRLVAVNPAARKVVDTTVNTDPNDWAQDYDALRADGTPVAPEERPIGRALQGQTTPETVMVLRPRRPEAGTRDVRLAASGYPLVDADGRRVGGAVLLRSATDAAEEAARAKRFESELHERVQVLDAIIRSMGDGVAVVDAEARFTLFNPSAERILGIGMTDRPPEEWTGLYGVFYPDGTTPVPAAELPLVRAVRGESVEDMELFIRNANVPDGVYISVNASPVRDESGKVVGGVSVFRDVSERRMQEEALTQAFAHGRLEVIDTVMHNIGNAINSVATGVGTLYGWFEDNELVRRFEAVSSLAQAHEHYWISWLERDAQGRKLRPFLVSLVSDLSRRQNDLRQTATRVRERVRHIEDIIRTQASFTNGTVERKVIHLPRAIGDVVKLVEESLEHRSVTVAIDCSRAPTEILVQESRFLQMLVNLVKNAMEAIAERLTRLGDPGGDWRPTVRLEAYRTARGLVIDVIDNGIGIESARLRSVFNAGYTTKRDGTGLGLHSAANFVIGSGGSIQPLSDGIGHGTTMRVTLRLPELAEEPKR